MKKIFSIILVLLLCLGLTACEEVSDNSQDNVTIVSENTQAITYNYKVEPMQSVTNAIYYGPNDYVPNCDDPSKVQGTISVWAQCPNCGQDTLGSFMINPKELDFSSGDTITHSDTDYCSDCSRNKGIDQFMWTVRITRIPEK